MRRVVHDAHLHPRHRGKADTAHEHQRDDGGDLVLRRERESDQDHREDHQQGNERLGQVLVRGAAAEDVADEQPDAEEDQQPRHGARGESADAREREGDVGEGAEHAAVAQDRHEHRQPDLRAAEDRELTKDACVGGSGEVARHQQHDAEKRDDANGRDGPEGRTPSGGLAEHRSKWHAEYVGDGESREHERDGAGTLGGRHQVGGDNRADAEERAVAQRRDDAPEHDQLVAGAGGREQVADDEQHHQEQQGLLAVVPAKHCREDDGADGDGEGVPGDEVARNGLGDPEIGGNLGQQAHDDELGQADAKAAKGEGIKSNWHENLLCVEVVERARRYRPDAFVACATTA